MQPGWIPQNFITCEAGASSAVDPQLLPDNQLAWLRNGRIRGGKQHTRPFLRERLVLPQGLVQGASYFSIQGGMFIIQIDGRIYRIRVGQKDSDFSYEEIPLTFINSPVLPTAWMVETVGSLVIQDGQSNPIIYDGSTARRSDVDASEVPLGRMMAYGNGRLWVAVGSNELVAGDIVTNEFQSELKFTETGYFLGGGRFLFPNAITGLKFIPSSGAAGYGSLAVFTEGQTYLIKADITARDLWAQIPGFIQPLLLSTGSIGQYGIAEVNQDLYWRDGDGGLRSIRSAIADETGGPGLTPMSREVSRITDFESVHRLVNTSAVNFDNRLLFTASPFINQYGKTSFRNLVSLDFSPISSMRGKSAPSYDGAWDGLLFDLLLTGKFVGTKRGFAISTDYDGNNRLWEITDNETAVADTYYTCMGTATLTDSQVPMVSEYPARSWESAAERKRLQRCDVYLSNVEGECELDVYYRPDNFQKWTKWGDTVSVCANTTDPEEQSEDTPHVWKNLVSQERPQIKTLTIDDEINNLTDYAKQVGFQFQLRTVLRGKARIHQITVWAQQILQSQYADREIDDALCRDNDVTGNEINYLISPEECQADAPTLTGDGDFGEVVIQSGFNGRYFIDLSSVLATYPTALAVWMYPVVGQVSDFLTSLYPIIPSDFSAQYDLTPQLIANTTSEDYQGIMFSVQTDASTEVAMPVVVSDQSGGFTSTNYANKNGNFNFLGASVSGILFPGVDVGPPPADLVNMSVLSEGNGWSFSASPS